MRCDLSEGGFAQCDAMGTPLPRLSVTMMMMMKKQMTMMMKIHTYDINDDCDDCDTGNLSSCDLISEV